MTIDVPDDIAQFIRDSISSGNFHSESDVVTAALRVFRNRETRRAQLQQEIQPAIDRLDRGEGIVLDDESLPAFFDDIIARGNERLGIVNDA